MSKEQDILVEAFVLGKLAGEELVQFEANAVLTD